MTIKTLTDRQKRVFAAVGELLQWICNNDACNYRVLAEKHSINISAIIRAMKHDATEIDRLGASDKRGRRKRLTEEVEKIICEAILEFHINGTPLSR